MPGWLLRGIVLLVVVVPVVLFAMQNSAYTTGLGLNLGFAAWELSQPASVPALMLGSLLCGLGLGAAWGLTRSRRARVAPADLGGSTSGPDW